MKVLVLGGGVIGVASAYYLSLAGHEVTVVERATEVARETSFANGGQISWSAASPWSAPGIPRTALKWMLQPHSPFVVRPRLDPAQWRWLWQAARNCARARFEHNKERMLSFARYSHECLTALRRDIGIEYDGRARGTLVLYRSRKELEAAARDDALYDRLNVRRRVLDLIGCVTQEPALSRVAEKIAGGIYFPEDESGDCHLFTLELARRAQQRGVRFALSTTVERLIVSGNHVEGVRTSAGTFSADAYVIACGSYTVSLLRPLGIRLPVYPIKGYSITVPVTDDATAPQGTLTDETYKTVITRLGDRVRAAGTAELAGYDLTLRPGRLKLLAHVVRDLFPGAGDLTRAEYWCGLRPMTPDNVPVLGATPYQNLFLNTGHGTLGWTLACGSGKAVADLIEGRRPDIDLAGLDLARFN